MQNNMQMETQTNSSSNMTVYRFSRSDSEILQNLVHVFNSGRGTAREQWSAQAELIVEPVGWDALWKLSKEFCKKFEVRYPCIAYVTVTSVDFEGLSACVDVLSVQHEAVSLPEMVEEVPLIELWPTMQQREQCIDDATTAEFIDLLRFYHTNIWMPWDDQDDKVVLPNTIENRMQLWLDLQNGSIPSCVARSIRLLRTSAINAFEKLRELDSSLCEGGLTDEDDSLLPPSYISLCAELSARLDGLMSQWTLYEDPRIREQYLAKARAKWQKHKAQRNVVALWQGGPISEFEEISQFVRARVSGEHTLTLLAAAADALALEPEELVLCGDCELPEAPLSHISLCSVKGATLKAPDMRSSLVVASDECRLRDLTLHCSRVTTAVLARTGPVRLTRCALRDQPGQSDFTQGILAMAGSKVLLEDCTIENFYTGIVAHKGAQVELRNCTVSNCGVGVQLYGGARVVLDNTTISSCTENSVRCDLHRAAPAAQIQELQIIPNCRIGTGDLEKEVLVVNQDVDLV